MFNSDPVVIAENRFQSQQKDNPAIPEIELRDLAEEKVKSYLEAQDPLELVDDLSTDLEDRASLAATLLKCAITPDMDCLKALTIRYLGKFRAKLEDEYLNNLPDDAA